MGFHDPLGPNVRTVSRILDRPIPRLYNQCNIRFSNFDNNIQIRSTFYLVYIEVVMKYKLDIFNTKCWNIQFHSGLVSLNDETAEWMKDNCKGDFRLIYVEWPCFLLEFENEDDRNWFALRWS